jgi:5-methylcytosine-specific restriction endonuclease McrA
MITENELRIKQVRFESERQANQSFYRKLEKLRQNFVSKFPPSRIPHLTLDDYVEGKGSKDSFCYWVEWKTSELGRIQGSNASKFGVFFDKKTQLYEVTSKFKDEIAAIIFLREQIARLLEAGRTNNLEVIRQIEISPMFKGKILFLYYPEKYLNIFSEDHIDHFLREIGLAVPDADIDVLAKRELLHAFKSNDEIMSNWTTQEFMRFLYDAWRPLPKSSKVPEALRKYLNVEVQTLDNDRVGLQNSTIDDIPSAPIGSKVPTRILTAGSRFQRDEKVRRFVIEQAKGTCEYCRELGFILPDGSHYLEAHHIIALANQGPDTVDNVIALCPSDHREAHYGANSVAMENEMIEIIKNRKNAQIA